MGTQETTLSVSDLRQAMRGNVLTAGDAGYDEARKIWNGDIDRRPAAIARVQSVADVQAAVAFARSRGLAIAVRSGGHSVCGHCIADGALQIDMRSMNQVTIDPKTRRAVVQGGAVWADVDGPAQALGLAVTGGHVTHTGVAGLTLGGGIGHLMRKFGLSSDNLLSAEIVTADGKVLKASATENPDLFWAIRGGGGNFGIATEFTFQLAPLGPEVFGGLAFWPPDKGPELMRRHRDLIANCPDEVTTIVAYLHAPPFDFVPKEVQLKPGYALIAAGTDLAVAEKTVKSIRTFSPPLFDVLGPMPYLALQSMIDPAMPIGTTAYLKAHNVPEYSDEVIATTHANTAKMPPGHSQCLLIQMGGAVSRVPEDATAFGGRKAALQTLLIGIWDDPAGRSGAVEWVRGFWDALEPHAQGAYINLSDEQDVNALRTTYGAEKFARLQRIKKQYDPENVFRLNQNIPPA